MAVVADGVCVADVDVVADTVAECETDDEDVAEAEALGVCVGDDVRIALRLVAVGLRVADSVVEGVDGDDAEAVHEAVDVRDAVVVAE